MFAEEKTLIVVYKDEMLVNQLKKLVESGDGAEGGPVIGTWNDSINIISWIEKVWLDNKKAGNIREKVFFLGDIKGTDKLIPVIDVKFDECGVRYGWAGNQAVLYIDPKAIGGREDYFAFLEKLSVLPVPEIIKNGNKPKVGNKPVDKACDTEQVVDTVEEASQGADMEAIDVVEEMPAKEPGFFKKAKAAIETGAGTFKKVGNNAAILSEDLFRDKAMVRRQMLFYGVVNFYNNDFESFMKI